MFFYYQEASSFLLTPNRSRFCLSRVLLLLYSFSQNWHEVPSLCLLLSVAVLRFAKAGPSSSWNLSKNRTHSSSFKSATFTKLALAGICSFALLWPDDVFSDLPLVKGFGGFLRVVSLRCVFFMEVESFERNVDLS